MFGYYEVGPRNGARGLLIQEGDIVEELGNITFEITVDQTFPYLSLVSGLQPSPDWFVGVSGLNLLDENGNFISEQEIALEIYDAGTDLGMSFEGGNIDANPREPITLLGQNPNFFPSFFVGFEEEIPGIANLRIRRIEE